jgi:hypothetical protein
MAVKCPTCGKSLKSSTTLARHMQLVHGKGKGK